MEKLKNKEKIDHTANMDRKSAIALLFIKKYNGLERNMEGKIDKNWKGKGGIIAKIKNNLGYRKNSGTDIEKVLLEIVLCECQGRKYDPKASGSKGHRTPTFALDSVEAAMIADSIEAGLSVSKTLVFLNEHLVGEGREPATISSIVSVISRLKPQVVKVQKQKQGSKDPNSDWAKARFLFTKQLLIRLGVIDLTANGPVEKRWDRDSLGHLALEQIT